MFSRLFDSYLSLITRYPKSTLIFLGLITAVLAAGLPNFKLDASADSLTLENDTDLDFFREVTKEFQSGDFLVVTFKPSGELFSDESLILLDQLRGELAAVEGVVGVNSILDVPLIYSPLQSLTEMVKEPRNLRTLGVDYQLAREEFLTSPVYKDFILSPDGQVTALQLNLAVDETFLALVKQRDELRERYKTGELSEAQATELERVSAELLSHRTAADERSRARVAKIRTIVASYKDRAEIFVGGLTMITADMISFIKSDLVVFGSAVVLFMILVLAIIFRSIKFVVIPMLCCVMAVVMMLGYVSWVDWRLTVISSNFVALLLIISLAIIIHLVVRYREFVEQQPNWTQRELVIATAQFMARPCLYTVLTSVVAFASLVVSDIRPVIDFGWLMTAGLLLALFLAFTILPAALMLFKRDVISASVVTHANGASRHPLTYYFSRFVERRGSLVLIVALIIALASAWGITRLQVENRFIDYFHKDTEIYQGLAVIDSDLGGTTSMDIIIDPPKVNKPAVANNPEVKFSDDEFGGDPFAAAASAADDEFSGEFGDDFDAGFGDAGTKAQQSKGSYWMTVSGLRQIEAVHDYLDSLPEVGKVQSLAILYKVGKDINGSLNDFELAIMQRALPDVVKSALVSPYLSEQNDRARISLRIHDGYPGLQRAELVRRIQKHLQDESLLAPDSYRFSGLLILYNNMLQSLFNSQIVTLGTVLIGILIMFMVLFQSIKLAFVAIIPTVVAASSILGFMGIFGLPLDMMTITVAAITVGIGVDNTIHYVHRFRREMEQDKDYIASMYRAHESIGRAMFYTSVIIIFGFAIMVLSAFIPTIYFGLLTGLAMFTALLGALLLLPKLLLWFKPF